MVVCKPILPSRFGKSVVMVTGLSRRPMGLGWTERGVLIQAGWQRPDCLVSRPLDEMKSAARFLLHSFGFASFSQCLFGGADKSANGSGKLPPCWLA